MKRHQIENIVPAVFTIISIYLIVRKFQIEILFLFGSILSIIGLVVWWFGKITLHDAFTSMPKANRIIKNGIYSKIRHPIYAGLSIMLMGWMFLFHNWIAYTICGITIITLIIRAYFEEKILTEKFGKAYINYRKNTWF